MNIIEQSHKIITPLYREDIYSFIEKCGRTAYKSEDKITTGSAEKFIKSIIKNGHESVLEHFNITVEFITDRGVTHELVRHRLCAFTQESTRYVNYQKKGMVFINDKTDPFDDVDLKVLYAIEKVYNRKIALGKTPQQARKILPNCLGAEIVVTANIREWRHILKLRTAKNAHPQMRALMIPLLNEFKEKIPAFFEDIT